MKDIIKNFYNMEVYDILFKNSFFIFTYNNYMFLFKKVNNYYDINYYIGLYKLIKLKNFKNFLVPIKNRNNCFFTLFDNKYYVLYCISYLYLKKVEYLDLCKKYFVGNYIDVSNYNCFNWISLWEKKIDYYDSFFYSNIKLFKNIYNFFLYFIGISELSLLYLKNSFSNSTNINYSFQHRRIGYNSTLFDFYDITNIIIDHPCRDFCEYTKNMIINHRFDISVFEKYLKYNNFSICDLKIMYSRIIFPSFFYDILDEYLVSNNFAIIDKITSLFDVYILSLRQINELLYSEYDIEIFNFI